MFYLKFTRARRETLVKLTGNERWDIKKFIENVHGKFHLYEALIVGGGLSISNHVRTYYYDANYDKDAHNFEKIKKNYEKNKKYFESLTDADFVDVKLGQFARARGRIQ